MFHRQFYQQPASNLAMINLQRPHLGFFCGSGDVPGPVSRENDIIVAFDRDWRLDESTGPDPKKVRLHSDAIDFATEMI